MTISPRSIGFASTERQPRLTQRLWPALLIFPWLLVGCDPADQARDDTPIAVMRDAPGDWLAYVSNEDSGDLTIIAVETNEVVGTIPVGKRPRGVRVSSDGRTVYVALSGSPKCPPTIPDEVCEQRIADKSADGIAVIDTVSRALTRVLPGGSDPEQFDINADQTRLYVSNEDSDQASIVDIVSGEVVKTIAVGREPEGVKLSQDGTQFYVTNESDHDVAIVDADTGEVLSKVKVGLRPRDVIFSADNTRAYVSAELGYSVAVIDVVNRSLITNIQMPEGSFAMGLALSPDNETLYVANGRATTVVKVDLTTNAVVGSVTAGVRPWGLAITGDGKFLYTANGPSNDVTVIDSTTFTVIATIAAGRSPWGVAIGPNPL